MKTLLDLIAILMLFVVILVLMLWPGGDKK